MFEWFHHMMRVRQSRKREERKTRDRRPEWVTLRDKILRYRRRCEACGSTLDLQVHHRVPVSVRPDMELAPNNLMVLCMGPLECHLRLGHGGEWKYHNPKVWVHAGETLRDPESRPKIETVAHQLKRVWVNEA